MRQERQIRDKRKRRERERERGKGRQVAEEEVEVSPNQSVPPHGKVMSPPPSPRSDHPPATRIEGNNRGERRGMWWVYYYILGSLAFRLRFSFPFRRDQIEISFLPVPSFRHCLFLLPSFFVFIMPGILLFIIIIPPFQELDHVGSCSRLSVPCFLFFSIGSFFSSFFSFFLIHILLILLLYRYIIFVSHYTQ